MVQTRLLAETIDRTRLRLLQIHAAIRAFAWRRGRLPRTLEEAGRSLVQDPLAGQPFQYQLLQGRGYDLFSLGTPRTGAIRLEPSPPKPTRAGDRP